MASTTATGKVYHLLSILYICAILNILFIAGVLVGGIIFGIGPSLVASHQLAKDHFEGRWDKPLRTFIKNYKDEFVNANKTIFILQIIALTYYLDIQLMNQLNWLNNIPLAILFLIISVIIISYLNLFGPIHTFYQVEIKKFYRVSMKFMFVNLAPMLLGLVWVSMCVGMTLLLPGLLPFLSFGIWILGIQGIYLQAFERNEKLLQTEKN